MNHYETLGLDPGASPEDIKAAYRRKAAKAHPDKQGGSNEAFHAVQRAADVLLDPDKRKRYDETGQDEAPRRPAAEDLLMQAFSELISDEKFSGDYVAEIKRRTQKMVAHIKDEIGDMRRKANRLDKLLKRVVVNEGETNAFAMVASHRARALRERIGQAEAQVAELNGLLEFMDAKGYADIAPDAPQQMRGVWVTTSGVFPDTFGRGGFP